MGSQKNQLGNNKYAGHRTLYRLHLLLFYTCYFTLVTQLLGAEFLSHVPLFATPWAVVHQAPLFMEFSRQEYWSGLPFPPPGDLPDTGIRSLSPTSAERFITADPPGKTFIYIYIYIPLDM